MDTRNNSQILTTDSMKSIESLEGLIHQSLETEQKKECLERIEQETPALMKKVAVWKAIERLSEGKYSGIDLRCKLDKVPIDIVAAATDEVCGEPGKLIQPSHDFLPYSLRLKPIIENKPVIKYPEDYKEILDKILLKDLLKDSSVRVLEIVKEYSSANTKRAFQGDILYWHVWLSAIGCDFLAPPISLEILKLFIIEHVEGLEPSVDKKLYEQGYKSRLGPHSIETVKRRIASLSVFLDLRRLDNPCRHKEVKKLLSLLAKQEAPKKKKQAVTKDVLDELVSTCKDSLIDIRDKAMLFFAWSSGGRRRSEVTSATIDNLTETADGNFLYNLMKSKTNQTGEDDFKPIKGRAAKALKDWLNKSGVTEGEIFRSISKGGDIRDALSSNDFNRIVKKRAALAGYDQSRFSAHSIRRGFVTESGRQGKPIGDVMKMTSHKSVSTALSYYEAGDIINNSCANLAG